MEKAIPSYILHAVEQIRVRFGTPFFLYDATLIRMQHSNLAFAFDGLPFQQFFAVKALPNPAILRLLLHEGSGFDCATPEEIALVQTVGSAPLVYTSNNTTKKQLDLAAASNCILIIDDIQILERLPDRSVELGIRVKCGQSNNRSIVGGRHSKFGMPPDQTIQAATQLKSKGVESIWLHCMESANTTDITDKINEALQLIKFADTVVKDTGLRIAGLNFGGGLGIPYQLGESTFDLATYSKTIRDALQIRSKWSPTIALECGRYVTGPSGYLAASVIGVYKKPHHVVGLDVSTSTMPRVNIYSDAYHHISFPHSRGKNHEVMDVVGSMCENSDKFCTTREILVPEKGDLALIHDVGAHCISMSTTYNSILRPMEFLLDNNKVMMITRAETLQDLSKRFVSVDIEEDRIHVART